MDQAHKDFDDCPDRPSDSPYRLLLLAGAAVIVVGSWAMALFR
jgi:hypothetical protein